MTIEYCEIRKVWLTLYNNKELTKHLTENEAKEYQKLFNTKWNI